MSNMKYLLEYSTDIRRHLTIHLEGRLERRFEGRFKRLLKSHSLETCQVSFCIKYIFRVRGAVLYQWS
jgi:hypothetical protein